MRQNAILSAARFGIAVAHSTLYTTMQPCFGCAKEIVQAKIEQVATFTRGFHRTRTLPWTGTKKAEYEKS